MIDATIGARGGPTPQPQDTWIAKVSPHSDDLVLRPLRYIVIKKPPGMGYVTTTDYNRLQEFQGNVTKGQVCLADGFPAKKNGNIEFRVLKFKRKSPAREHTKSPIELDEFEGICEEGMSGGLILDETGQNVISIIQGGAKEVKKTYGIPVSHLTQIMPQVFNDVATLRDFGYIPEN